MGPGDLDGFGHGEGGALQPQGAPGGAPLLLGGQDLGGAFQEQAQGAEHLLRLGNNIF